MNKIESNVLKMLNRLNYTNFPKMVFNGKMYGKYGLVITRFGMTLKEHYEQKMERFST